MIHTNYTLHLITECDTCGRKHSPLIKNLNLPVKLSYKLYKKLGIETALVSKSKKSKRGDPNLRLL